MRASYMLQGRAQRSRNFWQHDRPLPASFWTGRTGIDPVDTVVGRVLRHAYAHHIERLMVLANFMNLCGFAPHDIYRWFMELFIDAYDWVMVPNVYGMALHADGGLITTKPYVSGSNYILKMSDFRGGAWAATWDGLFWEFIERHRAFFDANPRLGVMARQLDRMDASRRAQHRQHAQTFLRGLQSG
jgi:deoxyribodipyrimidine photolyase-related protein